jgi:5-methylthioadenosine/S-adenosylhomocysteine deaminase
VSHALVDLAITNATIVTVDALDTVVPDGTVLVHDGAISYVGLPISFQAARTIDAGGGIVLPGLVNAHTHLAMTLFRGLADDVDLAGFLGRLVPAEAAVLSPATVAVGTRLALAELLRGGTTTALDMYFFPEAAHEVAVAAGFRLHSGPVFVEYDGPDAMPFPDRVRWACALAPQPFGIGSACWLEPHSTYLLSQDQLREIKALADETGARVHIHAAETRTELDLVRERHGRTPVQLLADVGLLGPRTVIAHGVHLDAADCALLAATGTSVTHCPASNQKLASGIAPVAELVEAGANVALGTDGAASANDLDVWFALRLAGYTQKVRHGAATLPAAALVRLATMGGARALGIDHLVGSVEVGKRADLVVLDGSSPSLTPVYDPVSALAYAAGRADVRWVVVDGRVVVDDRVLTTIDIEGAVAAARGVRTEVLAAIP